MLPPVPDLSVSDFSPNPSYQRAPLVLKLLLELRLFALAVTGSAFIADTLGP